MNSRQAKRAAHRWVAQIIHGALLNGDGDDYMGAETDADLERMRAEIIELADQHNRKGGSDE